MDHKLLRLCLEEYLSDIIEGRKRENPKFGKIKHFRDKGIKYDSLRKMIDGTQKWTLEYFIETANSFSIPPEHFISEIIRRYNKKSVG